MIIFIKVGFVTFTDYRSSRSSWQAFKVVFGLQLEFNHVIDDMIFSVDLLHKYYCYGSLFAMFCLVEASAKDLIVCYSHEMGLMWSFAVGQQYGVIFFVVDSIQKIKHFDEF